MAKCRECGYLICDHAPRKTPEYRWPRPAQPSRPDFGCNEPPAKPKWYVRIWSGAIALIFIGSNNGRYR